MLLAVSQSLTSVRVVMSPGLGLKEPPERFSIIDWCSLREGQRAERRGEEGKGEKNSILVKGRLTAVTKTQGKRKKKFNTPSAERITPALHYNMVLFRTAWVLQVCLGHTNE